MEDLKKIRGIDDETKKVFDKEKKELFDQLRKRSEERRKKLKQQDEEDEEIDRKNGRPGDIGLGRPIKWTDKNGVEHISA